MYYQGSFLHTLVQKFLIASLEIKIFAFSEEINLLSVSTVVPTVENSHVCKVGYSVLRNEYDQLVIANYQTART